MKKPSTPRRRIPKYRRQKRKKCADQAFVELDGRRCYLGEYGTPESTEAYDRVIAEWLTAGGTPPPSNGELTISELILRFYRHAQKHYRRPDGTSFPK